MRFETYSYAIFVQYTASYDRIYAAWLALMLLVVTTTLVVAEFRLLRGLSLERTGLGTRREQHLFNLGRWKWLAYAFVGFVVLVGIVMPVGVMAFWLGKGSEAIRVASLASAVFDSIRVSIPAAIAATLLAVPMALLSRRYPSTVSHLMERSAYLGYATPALAFALGLVFFSLHSAPFLYQTTGLLIFAYSIHFLAQAIGPLRAGLHIATPRLEEAARSLGMSPMATFRHITLPLLRPGLVSAATLVMLSCFKELPLTFLLSPLNFETLALNVYSYASEAMFAEAAPYALTIIVISTLLTAILFRNPSESLK